MKMKMKMVKKSFAVVLLAAVLLTPTIVVVVVDAQADGTDTEEFQCTGICGNNEEGLDELNNPDTVVTYSWNDNVPVGSSTIGDTEQTMSCQQFDLTLYSFSNDESECQEHQTGLQAAGCACGDGSGGGSISHPTRASSIVFVLSAVMAVSAAVFV
mmetsp:Transcript_47181/g.115273  ORF Transcript_47181/g.115273 Transcript_47181/m.115273 type:complete len:156 (+) Transcript_47181:167-634(+)|eukprot:CAMPEP_0113471160 /NCGR_PEP_ID=MMETSP0014_2-20120614/16834_1 /TAXON_ID=2857 /ORGANISM="Nitzschia sp." /LENGTH=155 /DNA_ID=CAMNT_0000363785 /DNA_START=89 /DNA_END=556 /DNA_ORIENTATION=- /assembly_acc=CAM_ASM_000159